MDKSRSALKGAHHIVIKLSSSIVADESGQINDGHLRTLAKEIVALRDQGRGVILITSGAMRVGLVKLGFRTPVRALAKRQAAASVGQSELIWYYRQIFEDLGVRIGQVLLTQADIFDRQRYVHVRDTLSSLIDSYNVLPIINENDTVSVEGIRFGENDRLAALVAVKVEADLLILLSDVAGLYTADPRKHPDASLIPVVTEISSEMEQQATGPSGSGAGGMRAKLQAAKVTMQSGVPMVVASGQEAGVIARIVDGESIGTLFVPSGAPLRARQRWLGFAAEPKGRVAVDEGAAKVLVSANTSLLAVGVTGVTGDFQPGDVVVVADPEGREIARGLVNYSADDLRQIQGRHSHEIGAILGTDSSPEVVHRDNLVLL